MVPVPTAELHNKLARICIPSEGEARVWLTSLVSCIGEGGLVVFGLGRDRIAFWLAGGSIKLCSRRTIWLVWSMTHCPTNLSSAFHFATWGRFNAEMPQDYRSQALRLLRRTSGPYRAKRPKLRKDGKPPKPLPHWKVSARLKKQYFPPLNLPLLLC